MFSDEVQNRFTKFMKRMTEKWSSPEYIEGSEPAYSFAVNKRQHRKAVEWSVEHDKTCKFADPMSRGAIGGRTVWTFCHTSLGTVIRMKCECGGEIDVSDYEEW